MSQTPCEKSELTSKKKIGFISDVAKGYCMGIAFIIPGFSGGSVAAILGIYEKLIGAIADIFRTFKKSILTLLPIFLGLCLGALSLLYPLGWALESHPLPTVSLFVGLALGGLPSITDKVKGRIMPTNVIAFAIPFVLAAMMSFLPTGADVDLLSLDFGGYASVFLVGVLGSCALVVPGISGSMLLLILGYYNPLIKLVTDNLFAGENILKALAVLLSAGIGIIVGFIGISVVMKKMLALYPRGTYFAILGFIIGSVPTVYISTAKDTGLTLASLPTSPIYWIITAAMLVLGFIGAFAFVMKVKKSGIEE